MGKFIAKTKDDYKQELIDKNRPFELLGDYLGANNKTLHKCIKCGYEFMSTPHIVLRTCVCPNCSSTINTTEKYRNKLKQLRPDMEVLEEFKGRKVKILHRHSCGYEYLIDPDHVLSGKVGGCISCYREKRRKTNEEFLEQIKHIKSNFRYIGEYQGANVKIKVVCNKGHEYYAYPYNIVKGHGCKQCVSDEHGKQCRLTNDEFVNRIKIQYPNISLLSEYITGDKPISYECSICGVKAISNRASSLLNYGCNCNRPNGEQIISKYLSERNIEFRPQMKFKGLVGKSKPLSYDFYIPSYNMLIEYQGKQHEMPIEHFGGLEYFQIQQTHDQLKYDYAKDNGYNILYIWYYDYNNIEKILDEHFKSESVETAG